MAEFTNVDFDTSVSSTESILMQITERLSELEGHEEANAFMADNIKESIPSGEAYYTWSDSLLSHASFRKMRSEAYDYIRPLDKLLVAIDLYGDEEMLSDYIVDHNEFAESFSSSETMKDRFHILMAYQPSLIMDLYLSDATMLDDLSDILSRSRYGDPIAFTREIAKHVSDVEEINPKTLKVNSDKFHLNEHHIYGSSRLGLRKYLAGEFEIVWDVDKDEADNMSFFQNNSEFYGQKPWYSYSMTNVIQANKINASPSNLNLDKFHSIRILGLKNYELTNHLGNVQAVVNDRKVRNPMTSTVTTPSFSAGLSAAYDYYPFGMLMPELYTELSVPQCITKTVNTINKVKVLKDQIHSTMLSTGAASGGGGTVLSAGAESSIIMSAPNEESPAKMQVVFSQTVQAGQEIEYSTGVRFPEMESNVQMTVKMYQPIPNSTEVYTISSQTIQHDGELVLGGICYNTQPVMMSYEMLPVYSQISQAQVYTGSYYWIDEVSGTKLVEYCSEDGDDYRFGFNTQEKVDEIAGKGNHNTALFGELDTRLGRRWNLDPKPSSSTSPYSVFGNSPIYMNDILLDTPGVNSIKPNGAPDNPCHGDIFRSSSGTGYVFDIAQEAGGAWIAGLSGVSVSAKGKGSSSNNKNVRQAAAWDIGRNDEMRNKVNMVEKGLVNTLYAGLTVVSLGASAIATTGVGLTMSRVSSAFGDMAGQLATNGGDFGKINLTSIMASGFIGNPFVGESIGQGLSYSSARGFSDSYLLGGQSTAQYISNISIAGAGGMLQSGMNSAVFTGMGTQTRISVMKDYLILGNTRARSMIGLGNVISNSATKTGVNIAQDKASDIINE